VLSLVIEDIGSPVVAPVSASQDLATSPPVRTLERNELLFEMGDLKTHLYRIESGALCIYVTHPDGTREIIEFALAGDLVGMGFLERHATNARAVIGTKVSCLALDEIDRLTAEDTRAKSRFDEAVEREFAFRRDQVSNAGRAGPLMQLAAFLVAVSRQNEDEGRDPKIIDDTLECAVVAGYLGISVECLESVLVELEELGLVQSAPHHGLRITDMERLQALADENAGPMLQSDLPAERRLLPGS
jgi:CRP/FNR family transcriptional regulator